MPAQRYVIIKLLEQLKDGDEFSPENYPLHITIVPSFQLEGMDDVLLGKIKQLCNNFKAFALTLSTCHLSIGGRVRPSVILNISPVADSGVSLSATQ